MRVNSGASGGIQPGALLPCESPELVELESRQKRHQVEAEEDEEVEVPEEMDEDRVVLDRRSAREAVPDPTEPRLVVVRPLDVEDSEVLPLEELLPDDARLLLLRRRRLLLPPSPATFLKTFLNVFFADFEVRRVLALVLVVPLTTLFGRLAAALSFLACRRARLFARRTASM